VRKKKTVRKTKTLRKTKRFPLKRKKMKTPEKKMQHCVGQTPEQKIWGKPLRRKTPYRARNRISRAI